MSPSTSIVPGRSGTRRGSPAGSYHPGRLARRFSPASLRRRPRRPDPRRREDQPSLSLPKPSTTRPACPSQAAWIRARQRPIAASASAVADGLVEPRAAADVGEEDGQVRSFVGHARIRSGVGPASPPPGSRARRGDDAVRARHLTPRRARAAPPVALELPRADAADRGQRIEVPRPRRAISASVLSWRIT